LIHSDSIEDRSFLALLVTATDLLSLTFPDLSVMVIFFISFLLSLDNHYTPERIPTGIKTIDYGKLVIISTNPPS